MATEYLTTDIDLKKVADGIRSRTGKTTPLAFPDGYVTEISTLTNTSADTVTADKLLKGTTAHDKSGKQITGTYVPLDTSDATAAASDIAKGKTAYVKGAKVTGNVQVIGGSDSVAVDATDQRESRNYLIAAGKMPYDALVKSGVDVATSLPLANLGNATAADVAKGKTFTSAAGLKVTGTASSSSGSSFEGASLAAYDELVYGVGFALNARNSYIVSIPYGEVVAIIEKRAFTYLDTAYSNVLNDNLKITGSTNGNLLYSEGTATSEDRNLSITSFEF